MKSILKNNSGEGPSLTLIFIGLAVSLFVLINSITMFVNFSETYNVNLSKNFTSTQNSLDEQYSNIDTVSRELNKKSFVEEIWNNADAIISGSFNIFITGLSAIGKLFNSIEIIESLIQLASNTIGLPLVSLISLITIISTIYIAMKYIQARRGSGNIS